MVEEMKYECLQFKGWNDYKNAVELLKKDTAYETEEEAIAFARTFCYKVIQSIWSSVDYRKRWKCRQLKFDKIELSFVALKLAKEIAGYLTTLNIMEYAYLIGNLYTMLLPDAYRSSNGVYYTPPTLAERLLDILAAEGADWSSDNVLDPACGGGSFLVTVASRMLGDYRVREMTAEEKISHLENHLAGYELDSFAALLTQCLLDIIVYSESIIAGRRLKSLIKVQDTVQYALKEKRRFDVIVGNPPYGKVTLDEDTREKYARSLYGHANLYGLFIDASIHLMKTEGLVGFVTPTSFLGGKYFSNLRKLLADMAPPLAIDFVSMRAGVFEQVLQETCLVVFGNNPNKTVTASKINVESDLYNVERIGSFEIKKGTEPWIIAREADEAKIINRVKDIGTTIVDYGYKISTGQLVWNRLKGQIRSKRRPGLKPIIWAEAITAQGDFDFGYESRKKMKYIKVKENQQFLICNQSVVLVQRTTAKEQNRRLQTCVLPQEFIDEWGGAVVENHVNIIHQVVDAPSVSVEAVSLLLNSKTVDRIFRCLSGSVAVSASELHAIPLPAADRLEELETYITRRNNNQNEDELLEEIILRAYGLEGVLA